MNHFRFSLVLGLLVASSARAVYAPIPEQEQGKDFTFSLSAGISHDSNIFGGATGAIGSDIWEVSPKGIYNASITDQTFVALSYQLTFDYFHDRPGEKDLTSHSVSGRVAHSFSPTSTLDLTEAFQSSRNPESLLNGVPINTDQSLYRNEFDGTYTAALAPKLNMALKARSVYYDYRNSNLADLLNRFENLYGLSGDYAVLPDVKAVAEYRHQDIDYSTDPDSKNKHSDFFMAGADYAFAKKLTATGRLGFEYRQRAGASNITVPYAEFTGKYDYADGSFITGGYTYTIEESSDPTQFDDSKINRFFGSIQHSITPLLVASGSLTYESDVLQGRATFRDINEDVFRAGAALSYLPTKRWTLSVNYDYDHINSQEASRRLDRERYGINASYTF